MLDSKIKVINIGIDSFADDMRKQGADVVNVDWRPPPVLDKKTIDLLDKLGV